MLRPMLVSCAVLALAGCGGASTEDSARRTGDIHLENASMDEVAKQADAARDKSSMQPGKWENRVEVLSVDLPGVPAGAEREALTAQFKSQDRTQQACVSAEQAKKRDFTRLAAVSKDCRFPRYVIAGGKIDAHIQCTDPAGKPIDVTMTGTTGKTDYDITLAQTMTLPGQSAPAKVAMRISGNRLGDCQP